MSKLLDLAKRFPPGHDKQLVTQPAGYLFILLLRLVYWRHLVLARLLACLSRFLHGSFGIFASELSPGRNEKRNKKLQAQHERHRIRRRQRLLRLLHQLHLVRVVILSSNPSRPAPTAHLAETVAMGVETDIVEAVCLRQH